MEHIKEELENSQQQLYDNNDHEYLQDEGDEYLHETQTEQPEAHRFNYTILHDLEDVRPTEEIDVEIIL